LNYNDLKARAKGHRVVPVPGSSAFIEFAAISTVDYTIEMERPGERMSITGSCNVVELAREFWRR
jgi:dTDP-D-glucose 4,6-dehydratase